MINKKIDEISAKLETIKVLVQDNEYLENIEKRCDEVNEKYTQALEVAQERFNRIQKAIEYIENDNFWHSQVESEKRLLDILKGGE